MNSDEQAGSPIYWLQMIYRCNGTNGHRAWEGDPDAPEEFKQWRAPRPAVLPSAPCGYETPFLLEYGCEGPKSDRTGYTPSGRPWVPVPFGAGLCPNCGVGDLLHADWKKDKEIQVIGPLEVPHFRYPTRAEFKKHGNQACGYPVYAEPKLTHKAG